MITKKIKKTRSKRDDARVKMNILGSRYADAARIFAAEHDSMVTRRELDFMKCDKAGVAVGYLEMGCGFWTILSGAEETARLLGGIFKDKISYFEFADGSVAEFNKAKLSIKKI